MKASLVTRLKRLETVKAAECQSGVELQIGTIQSYLPGHYKGERHLITVGREPNGHYLWEEQPGP